MYPIVTTCCTVWHFQFSCRLKLTATRPGEGLPTGRKSLIRRGFWVGIRIAGAEVGFLAEISTYLVVILTLVNSKELTHVLGPQANDRRSGRFGATLRRPDGNQRTGGTLEARVRPVRWAIEHRSRKHADADLSHHSLMRPTQTM